MKKNILFIGFSSYSFLNFYEKLIIKNSKKFNIYIITDYVDSTNTKWNNHVELGLWADIFIIAPATANTISKLSQGSSEDLASTVVLASNKQVFSRQKRFFIISG